MSHAIVITVDWLQNFIKYVKPFWLFMQVYDEFYNYTDVYRPKRYFYKWQRVALLESKVISYNPAFHWNSWTW